MDDDIRRRVLLPIVLPIVVLGTILAFVGAVAVTLLYNTRSGALMLAAVAAGGILFTISLAASQERLGGARRGVVAFAGLLPLLVGVGFATGLIGDIEDEQRMANVQPLVTIPDDVPWIGAENAQEFCVLDEAGEACLEPMTRWEVVPSVAVETLAFGFANLDGGVPHNVVIAELEGTVDAPEQGADIAGSPLINGVQRDYYVDDTITWDDLDEHWYFYCVVHPNMQGVGTVIDEAA